MKFLSLLLLLFTFTLQAQYQDSKSCQECHEDIYAEHSHSMHHKSSILKDEVHRKVVEITTPDKYSCALCHMPATKNLAGMIRGMDRPNPKEVRHQDGVSCFYCHQINNIYHAKAFNINFSSYREGEKPTFFGNLDNADDSDNHKTGKHPFYQDSEVCMGCHSHKENKHEVQVCNGLDNFNKKSDCIGCHMPKKEGIIEKFDKKSRSEYASHEFLGIHSEEMVKKAVKLELTQSKKGFSLSITNMMGHAIITQPMRLKFVKTVIKRNEEVIWSNYKESPIEDKEATFIIVFKDENGKATMPGSARGFKVQQNLAALETKVIDYRVKLKKGDEVSSMWMSYIINPRIAKKLDITDKETTRVYQGAQTHLLIH